jgi:alginate O-acetyltransferase complex protein AlgI
MVFSSPEFIILVLPFALLAAVLTRGRGGLFIFCILATSFISYGQRYYGNLPVLLTSILINFTAGLLIARSSTERRRMALGIVYITVVLNLASIYLYKYATFVEWEMKELTGHDVGFAAQYILPLGISVFIFQQIAYIIAVGRSGQAAKGCLNMRPL